MENKKKWGICQIQFYTRYFHDEGTFLKHLLRYENFDL